MNEYQALINAGLTIVITGLGWFLKALWDAVKDLQKSDKDLVDKVSHIEVIVAGQYVRGDKFDAVVNRIFDKLDKIELKIDNKVDK
jgi:hypothetical protein